MKNYTLIDAAASIMVKEGVIHDEKSLSTEEDYLQDQQLRGYILTKRGGRPFVALHRECASNYINL